MVALVFNALLFDSQTTPQALPEPYDDGFPADCGLTDDQKADLGQSSTFVGLMDTPAKVIRHWELVNEERAKRAAQVAKEVKVDPVERARLAQERAERTNVVTEAAEEWRKAVAGRDAAMAQWNAFVKEKRDRYRAVKAGLAIGGCD